MAEHKPTVEFKPGRAAEAVVSLSQVLLAPLNSIFKAQIHASRSLLNLLLQVGYPHIPTNSAEPIDGAPPPAEDQGMYLVPFPIETQDATGKVIKTTIKIPALALVPLHPLSIEEASFDLDFKVSHVERWRQIQESEDDTTKKEERYDAYKRPWYLVSDPISVRGVLANKPDKAATGVDDSEEATIKISIKITRQAVPAGIDKLLATLTQAGRIETK